jgi:hypothetical protein
MILSSASAFFQVLGAFKKEKLGTDQVLSSICHQLYGEERRSDGADCFHNSSCSSSFFIDKQNSVSHLRGGLYDETPTAGEMKNTTCLLQRIGFLKVSFKPCLVQIPIKEKRLWI